MSAESIARWNSIPMSRQDIGIDQPESYRSSLKRPREDDDDADMDGEESEDNVSIASHSPSPLPPDQMDVDKYDEYVAGAVREVVTVNTKISETNKGFAMLAKLGWTDGQPLGLSGEGRVEPIPFYVKRDLTGLGKTNQDVRMIETTVSQRRELDSERQQKETEEQRLIREVCARLNSHILFVLTSIYKNSVARRAAVQSEISETLRAFYCNVCEKQFQNVAQYDEHTNSYAHHHKVRFRDMQMAQRQKQNTEEELNKRKEKERKREEKELRKIAAAAGIKIAKPATPIGSMPALAGISADSTAKAPEPRKGGWTTVSTASADAFAAAQSASPSPSAFRRASNWASVDGSPPPPPISAGDRVPAVSHANSHPLSPVPSMPPQPLTPAQPPHTHHPAPSFRNAGWSSLDTSSPMPPPQLPTILVLTRSMGGWTWRGRRRG
ncbi:hypothetical protein EW146_g40 [Bondarzewia mesenterica]|uniref:G-patch domain-containing protein n=1 Tax=Bondarzewia mesenterica TaxID=1095465 RepID=A0A4S4M9V4_9AGAM|nr:hypothetical protein EW146_g40 [Bondarzewia mesenterica]